MDSGLISWRFLPENSQCDVDQSKTADRVCKALGNRLIAGDLTTTDDGSHQNSDENNQLDADLHVVDSTVIHLKQTHEHQAGEQLNPGADVLPLQDGWFLEGSKPATDERGGSQQVEEEEQ